MRPFDVFLMAWCLGSSELAGGGVFGSRIAVRCLATAIVIVTGLGSCRSSGSDLVSKHQT